MKVAPLPGSDRYQTLGYLTSGEMPDGAAILPAPPAAGSAAMQRDENARTAALRLKGSARYALATADASRKQATTVTAFECTFASEITPARTPVLYQLLARVRLDVAGRDPALRATPLDCLADVERFLAVSRGVADEDLRFRLLLIR